MSLTTEFDLDSRLFFVRLVLNIDLPNFRAWGMSRPESSKKMKVDGERGRPNLMKLKSSGKDLDTPSLKEYVHTDKGEEGSEDMAVEAGRQAGRHVWMGQKPDSSQVETIKGMQPGLDGERARPKLMKLWPSGKDLEVKFTAVHTPSLKEYVHTDKGEDMEVETKFKPEETKMEKKKEEETVDGMETGKRKEEASPGTSFFYRERGSQEQDPEEVQHYTVAALPPPPPRGGDTMRVPQDAQEPDFEPFVPEDTVRVQELRRQLQVNNLL